jgi:hypothetical protein
MKIFEFDIPDEEGLIVFEAFVAKRYKFLLGLDTAAPTRPLIVIFFIYLAMN